MAAKEVVSRGISIYIQSGDAQKVYDTLITKQKKLNEELAAVGTHPKRIAVLKEELKKLEEPITRAGKKLKGEMLPTLRDLENATRKWMNEFKKTGDPTGLANFKKFNAELQSAKKQVNGLESAQKSLSSGSIFKGSFWANLAANGISRVTSLISSGISSAFKWAKELSGVELAFKRIATPGLLEELRTATRGTVSDLELMKKAVNANNFQIPLETLGTLLKFAQQRARETGQSVEYLTESIVLGIARKSPLILDNLGINIKRIQTEFKKSGDFAKAATKIVNEELQKSGPYVETFGDKVDRIKTFFTNAATSAAKFVVKLVEGRKSANQLFDEAKANTEAYEKALVPLLSRYDELKAKATLNKDEQSELRGIIEKIVKIVPEAATEFDKYGIALDINKQKVIEFRKENDKFLQQRERSAISSLTSQAQSEVDEINRLIAARDRSQANFKKYNTSQQTSNEALAISQEAIAKFQEKLITTTDVLINKYKVKLPDAINSMREAALRLKFDVGNATPPPPNGKKELTEEEKAAAEARAKEQADKALAAARKAAEERKRLIEELNKIEFDLSLFGVSDKDKEFIKLKEKYKELAAQAKGDTQILLRIQQLYQTERFQLIQTYIEKEVDAWKQAQKEVISKADAAMLSSITKGKELMDRLSKEIFDSAEKRNIDFAKNRLAGFELASIQATGKKKLAAELDLLKEQERQELDNKELTEKEILLIIQTYLQKRQQLIKDYEVSKIQEVLDYAQQALDILNTINSSKTDNENAELERDRQINEQKKQNLDRRLKAGTISQLQYDRELQKIEREQQARERKIRKEQFEREKAAAATQALINGALAVTNIWATTPKADFGISTYIMLGLSALATLASVASITSRKPPTFEKGGKLGGRSHANGGNAIIDGQGRKIAEIEKGEGIINRRTMADGSHYTLSGSPSQIASMLNAMHGGVNWQPGARLIPGWASSKPVPFNFARIKSHYASGGRFAENAAATPQDNKQMMIMLESVYMVMNQVSNQLKTPIKTYMLITESEIQQDRLSAIRDDATMRG